MTSNFAETYLRKIVTSQLNTLCFVVHRNFERKNVAPVHEMENLTQASDYVTKQKTLQSNNRR